MLRRTFHTISGITRNMYINKNLYRVQYVIPLYDDKIGRVESIEIKTNDAVREIILTFDNPEMTQYIKKLEQEQEQDPGMVVQKYHYLS